MKFMGTLIILIGLIIAVCCYQLLSYQESGIAYVLTINQPIPIVFDYVINPGKKSLWITGLITGSAKSDNIKIGNKFTHILEIDKERLELEEEIIAIEPNDSVEIRTVVREGYEAIGTTTFYETPTGTRVEFVQDIVYINNLGKVLAPFLLKATQNKVENDFNYLKTILEK